MDATVKTKLDELGQALAAVGINGDPEDYALLSLFARVFKAMKAKEAFEAAKAQARAGREAALAKANPTPVEP